jgi:polysaccharide chain length determinant protein (PEP-CTERM system associated)
MTDGNSQHSVIETALDIGRRRKWLVLVSFLLVFVVVYGYVKALPKLYRASTTLIVAQDIVAESLVENDVTTELELRLGLIQQALMSREQLQEVVEEFNLYENMRQVAPPAAVAERLRRDITIKQEAYSKPLMRRGTASFFVTISFRAWDPDLAAEVANGLARRFQAEDERNRSRETTRAIGIVRSQLESAREEFQVQEERLTEFRNEHMGNLPEQQDINLSTLSRLNSELMINGERQLALAERQEAVLNAAIASGSSAAAANTLPGPLRLERLEQELQQSRGVYTENHPEIIRLEREIQELRLELIRQSPAPDGAEESPDPDVSPTQADRDMAQLKADERRIKGAIAAMTRRIEDVPRVDQQLRRLTSDYEDARKVYLEQQALYRDAVLAQSLETEKKEGVKIVEVAIPPNSPFAPDRDKLLFVGLVLAGGFAATLLFLAEQLNKSFHSTRDLRRFTRIPVLASIGDIQTPKEQWMGRVRFGVQVVLIAASLLLLTTVSYQLGLGGRQLVMAMSG